MTNRFLLTGGLREAWFFMLISMLPEMVELAKILDKPQFAGSSEWAIGWAGRSLVCNCRKFRLESLLPDTLYVFVAGNLHWACIMCVGGTWLSFSFWIIVLRAEWLVIFSLFVKFAFTAIVFITAYSLLTPTAVLLNQACASFFSLTLFTAIGSKNGKSALLQSSGLLWPNAL